MKVKWRDIFLICSFILTSSIDLVAPIGESQFNPTGVSITGPESSTKVEYNYTRANETTEDATRQGLRETCRADEACVRKCCPTGEMMQAESYNCTSIGPLHLPEWKPKIGPTNNLSILYGLPPQSRGGESVCIILDSSEYVMNTKNGKLIYKERQKEYSHEFYCLDYNFNDDLEVTEFAVACVTIITKSSFDNWADVFHRLGLGISSICLFVILILYFISSERAELPNKCIITCCVNLLASFLLIIINMTEWVTTNISPPMCVSLGLSIQFFFLSFYFWLNVMMYNIFKFYQQVLSGINWKVRLKDNKTIYIRYCLYAFGVPATITIVTAIMQSLPHDYDDFLIRPRIGEGRCWFPDEGLALYLYYYGFEVLLHAGNAIIIIRAMRLFNGEETKKSVFRQQLFKFRRQFYVFTLFAFIWMLNLLTLTDSHKPFWRVLDILISLQGVFFLVIVLLYGKDTWQDAYEKVSNLLQKSKPASFQKAQPLRTKSQEHSSVTFY